MQKKENERFDNAASLKFQITRSKAKRLIEAGNIKVNGRTEKPSYKINEIDEIKFEMPEKNEAEPLDIPLDIVYEDDYLIVLNKQKGLLCHPTSYQKKSLVSALLYHTNKLSDIQGKNRAGIIHRLDKNTSGLMLAAKTNEVHIALQGDIQTKKVIRKYLAICHGVIKENSGTINKPLVHYMKKSVKMNTANEGLYAVTHFKVLERFENATFLSIQLETGRTHQIRCHFASINHPIAGDDLYGAGGFENGIFKNLKTQGQVLMSNYIRFIHPVSREIMEFEIKEKDYHPDLKKTLDLLRGKNK